MPIQFVVRSPFNQMAVPSRILRVAAFPFSFVLSLSPSQVPSVPIAIHISLTKRQPNTPHNRRVESESLDDDVQNELSIASEETSSTEKPSSDDNKSKMGPSTAPPLIHVSEH